jgi:pSer/pThr/pTyr-binding forkhead associated (FHA) protein
MPEIVLQLLKYVFLIVLYVFIARAVRLIHLELKPAGARKPAPVIQTRQPSKKVKVPKKVTIVEGDANKGKSFDLGEELIIGRAEKCHIVLDDTYVSQMHARIFARGETYMAEDLGSTNGTYLNRRRITSPVEVSRGDQVKIGKTVMEFRR